jgi:hypothetical protein
MAGVVILFSIPFLLTGDFSTYARSLFLPGQAPGYQSPLMYAFSGSGALLTYLHDIFGWETSGFLNFNTPIMVLAILASFVLSYKRSISAAQGALIGSLIFISLFYRVNYQYLIIYIPIALLVASRTKYRSERIFTIVMALLPAAWLWLFEVPFWFRYIDPKNPWVTQILERIGLAHTGTPDYAFVSLAMVLMCLFLAYIICAFIRWRQPLNNVEQI